MSTRSFRSGMRIAKRWQPLQSRAVAVSLRVAAEGSESIASVLVQVPNVARRYLRDNRADPRLKGAEKGLGARATVFAAVLKRFTKTAFRQFRNSAGTFFSVLGHATPGIVIGILVFLFLNGYLNDTIAYIQRIRQEVKENKVGVITPEEIIAKAAAEEKRDQDGSANQLSEFASNRDYATGLLFSGNKNKISVMYNEYKRVWPPVVPRAAPKAKAISSIMKTAGRVSQAFSKFLNSSENKQAPVILPQFRIETQPLTKNGPPPPPLVKQFWAKDPNKKIRFVLETPTVRFSVPGEAVYLIAYMFPKAPSPKSFGANNPPEVT